MARVSRVVLGRLYVVDRLIPVIGPADAERIDYLCPRAGLSHPEATITLPARSTSSRPPERGDEFRR